MADLAEEVEALERLDLFEMRALWAERFGTTPRFQSVELFRLMLAWRMQAAVHGGLHLTTLKALRRSELVIVEGPDQATVLGRLDAKAKRALRQPGLVIAEPHELRDGLTIRRQWRGEEVIVIVTDDGFSWNGITFRSLSAAARAITGTRWNGPKFFGLR